MTDYFAKDLKEHERTLFKFQQGELENTCEKTHKLLESDIDPYINKSATEQEPFLKFKYKVVN